ncbi:MAG TPA: hypothetical protein QF753_17000 [Victivallales bacterium]|nr:hypothetical protein [Victivallales bacterium]
MKILNKFMPAILITIAIVVGLTVLMNPPTNSNVTSENPTHHISKNKMPV